jgi:deoxyribodipyrimidine photolyase
MIIAVDFDGTIVTHEYPNIGKEIPFAIATLKKLQEDHQLRLIMWTVREGKELEEAVEYCKKRGLEFYAVNSNYPEEKPEHKEPRKLKADLFIDDRNLGGLPDWGVIYQMIASGQHFNMESLFSPYNNNEFTNKGSGKKKGFLKSVFG